MALSLFPDPITGRYKDASWQALGEELKDLLTSDEYDSAKRTTFNAFYTSPTVIAAMHEALSRLGVSERATVLEPGCGIGNFMSYGPRDRRFIGVELDSISGRIARALHAEADNRVGGRRLSRGLGVSRQLPPTVMQVSSRPPPNRTGTLSRHPALQ